jgi:ABC-type phosphate transport system substrate-binding protein
MSRAKKLISASVLLAAAVASATAAGSVPAMGSVPAESAHVSGLSHRAVPAANDVVGVGSGVSGSVFDQLSHDYNKTVKAGAPQLFSWDATNPSSGKTHDIIVAKDGCAKAPRPADSSEGILGSQNNPLGLTANTITSAGMFCTDFARSARGRAPNDPPAGLGGIQFLPFAIDAVTFATNAKTDAPARLTTAQLARIYTCAVTNWRKVGGKDAPINAQLPPATSDTRTVFLTALGNGQPIRPGKCVDAGPNENPRNLPAENEGVSRYLHGPDVIFPYSVAAYLAQAYHSAACVNFSCTPVRTIICKPRAGQNLFSCDTRGTMVLHPIDKTNPATPFPLPRVCAKTGCPVINAKFAPAYTKRQFVVVRWTAGTPADIPAYLLGFFGPKGWVCVSRTAHTDIGNYGFIALRASFTVSDRGARKMTC